MEQNVVLEMRDISKNFTGVRALSHVDFTLRKGEIHALMGENGAGKSTLIKVLTGVHSLDGGEIRIAGSDAPIINKLPAGCPEPRYQYRVSGKLIFVRICQWRSNLFIGREPRKFGFIDWHTMNKKATELLKSLI